MEETYIPLPDERADLVMMLQVHHELTDPQALLVDCYRVIKPGGTLAIVDWKDEDNGKSLLRAVEFLNRQFGLKWTKQNSGRFNPTPFMHITTS